jgi:hypothetical protein
MAVTRIKLKDFSAFRSAEVDLGPGINVFIGANATGKTHVMKVAYAALKAVAADDAELPLDARLKQKILRVFRPENADLNRLLHHWSRRAEGHVDIEIDGAPRLAFSIKPKGARLIVDALAAGSTPPGSCVFVPSREGLASHPGFIAAYNARELAFDETYFDLALALDAQPLRALAHKPLREAIADLQNILGGFVQLAEGGFSVVLDQKPGVFSIEAHLLSEGMRKIASVARLVSNGSIDRGTTLFWDEPEANLNPTLTVALVDVLVALARGGVQIVLATHDYLLSETIALQTRRGGAAPTRYLAFKRDADATSVVVEGADDLDDLSHNPIREESLRHYDRVRGA